MALLGASFQIGRSALAAYQAALAVAGQNIANVGNPDYARQTGRLTALQGGPVLGGIAPGAGVALTELRRNVDEAVEGRLRTALSSKSGAETKYQNLSQVESLYNELTDQDVSTQLGQLFGSFGALQTQPRDMTARNLVLAGADNLVRTLHRQRTGLLQQVSDLNTAATAAVDRANGIISEIARLNEQIVQGEAGGQSLASPLRDRRDGLLRDLSELMDVQVRQQDNGTINLYVGSEPLVEFNRSRGLTTQITQTNGYEIATVRFADNNGTVVLRGGRLAAIVETRDTHLAGQIGQLDQLAKGLIYEVNRAHSMGRGMVGHQQLTGTYDVANPDAALNTTPAGLQFPVQNGTFIVHVRDTATGQTITRQIEIDLDGLNGDDTTLRSLAATLDGVPGLASSVTTDNRLSVQADTGQEVWFTEDSSGALAALGVGGFFQGTHAGNIEVQDSVRNDPRLIAAAQSDATNDGDNAGRLAAVGEVASALLNNQTIQDFHATIIGGLATETAAAKTEYDASDAVYAGLVAQRESISGVSLDEEAINLTKFEKAFESASRYLNVLNNLSDSVLALVR